MNKIFVIALTLVVGLFLGCSTTWPDNSGIVGTSSVVDEPQVEEATPEVRICPPIGFPMVSACAELPNVGVVSLSYATPSGWATDGPLWVGGDLVTDMGYDVNTAGPASCDDWGLIVDGSVWGNVNLPSGKAAYGDEFTGAFRSSQGCSNTQASPVDFDLLGNTYRECSIEIQNRKARGKATISGVYLRLSGMDPNLNVFNITAEQFDNNLHLDVPPTSAVVVNVSGLDVIWVGHIIKTPDDMGDCFSGTSTWCTKTLFNFYEATNVYVYGASLQGSVLAPYATFDGGNGNMDGQLVARHFAGGLDYHSYRFSWEVL